MFAHAAQGFEKEKSPLRTLRKGECTLGERWQKVGKGEQRQANRPGGRRSKQTDSPESEGGQLYKKKADHLVCFLFAIIAHYE